jgi:hypothetical protein
MKQASKMRMSTLLALGGRSQQSAAPVEWPKDFGAYIAMSSEEIPLFPSTLSGFRSENGKDFWGKPFSTTGSIRIGQGGDWEGIWKFSKYDEWMFSWRFYDPLEVC